MEKIFIGISIGFICVALIVFGEFTNDDLINNHCKNYGKYATDKYILTCTAK